jgi:AAA+ ATPase superfamily predicted ATPase
MQSPFAYDRLPQKGEFYGRAQELARVNQAIRHGTNLLIYSKRRMGKSALIHQALSLQDDETLCLYTDIFHITSKESFAQSLLESLASAQKGDLKATLKKLTALFKRVRVEPVIDPHTFEYAIRPVVATLSFEEMLSDFFEGIQILAQKQRIVVAIDEFQQIAGISDVRLDALLRRQIQQRHRISWIFLGSKRHLLTSLFEYKAPLYEMATHFELPALSLDEIEAYVTQHLNIDRTQIEEIFARADGETKLMQNIFHLLYLQKDQSVTPELIDTAINEIISSKDASYRMLYDTLSQNQKTALKVIGKHKKAIYSAPVLQAYHIKKQTLQSAIDALQKKELIDRDGDSFLLPDRTLELWVERL